MFRFMLGLSWTETGDLLPGNSSTESTGGTQTSATGLLEIVVVMQFSSEGTESFTASASDELIVTEDSTTGSEGFSLARVTSIDGVAGIGVVVVVAFLVELFAMPLLELLFDSVETRGTKTLADDGGDIDCVFRNLTLRKSTLISLELFGDI